MSENPIVGADEKEDDFYHAVTDVYNGKYKPVNREVRTKDSVRKILVTIKKTLHALCGCVIPIKHQKPTGTDNADIIKMAKACFNGVELKSVTENSSPAFRVVEFWNEFGNHAKLGADLESNASVTTSGYVNSVS